jgi:hypothetical protein
LIRYELYLELFVWSSSFTEIIDICSFRHSPLGHPFLYQPYIYLGGDVRSTFVHALADEDFIHDIRPAMAYFL